MQADNETLTLHYEVSVEDRLGFSLYHAMHSATIKRSLRLYQFMPPAIWTALALLCMLTLGSTGIGMAIPFFLISLLWLPLAPKIWYGRVKKQTQRMLSEGL